MVLRTRTAAYWEGFDAWKTHQKCPYPDGRDRQQWAAGFARAVDDDRDSKVWYKSRTILVGLALLMAGIVIAVWGMTSGNGNGPVYAAAGGGMSGSSLVMTALRLITNQNVTLTGGGSQYSPPPT